MSIKVSIAGRAPLELEHECITLGSDPSCTVPLADVPGMKPTHAEIRLIDGKWIIEAKEAEALYVGGHLAKKAHWINSGDVICFSKDGLAVTLDLLEDKPRRPAPVPRSKKESDVFLLPDSDSSLPVVAPVSKSVKKPLSSAIIQVPKSSSSSIPQVSKSPPSAVIPTAKQSSSSTPLIAKSPSSSTVKIPKPTSSMAIPTKPLTSTSIPTQKKSSSEVSPSGKAKSSGTDLNIPTKTAKRSPSSTQIPAYNPDADEPKAGLPVLKRLSSYEAPVISLDDDSISSYEDSPKRRKSAKEDEDVQFIKMVITRSVGAGLIILIVLIGIMELWKAFGPQRTGTTSASTVYLENQGSTSTTSSALIPADEMQVRHVDQVILEQPSKKKQSKYSNDNETWFALLGSPKTVVASIHIELIERTSLKLDVQPSTTQKQ
jgi:hypothetical protein